MPRNKDKRGRYKRGEKPRETEERELEFKEDGQEYAQVNKMLGHCTLEAMCFDGKKRLCHIRGRLRNKIWIYQGDFILISLRHFQDSRADVIWKYTSEEALRLQCYGELPEHIDIVDDGMDDYIEFRYED